MIAGMKENLKMVFHVYQGAQPRARSNNSLDRPVLDIAKIFTRLIHSAEPSLS